jgi:hypothetical protein
MGHDDLTVRSDHDVPGARQIVESRTHLARGGAEGDGQVGDRRRPPGVPEPAVHREPEVLDIHIGHATPPPRRADALASA